MAKHKDIEGAADAEMENDAESRVYELGMHLDPELPVEEVKKVCSALHKLLAEQGAVVVAEVEPEKIALAYTISRQEVAGRRDFDSAYFAWIVYEATIAAHESIVAAVRANSHIVRCIDLTTTKDAARHALEAHELSKKTVPVAESAIPADETMTAELDVALESATL
jgi:ribosomal protein S6